MMKSFFASAAVALGVMLAPPVDAAPVLLDSFIHNYGSNPGLVNPGGSDVLGPNYVTVTDQSTTAVAQRDRFFDNFNLVSLIGDTIERFELILTFSLAGPSGNQAQCFFGLPVCEVWQVRINGSNDGLRTDDFFATLVSANSPETFALTILNDTGSRNAFAHSAATNDFSFWFSENSTRLDSFDLESARLNVFGTPAPIPVPAALPLMLLALGGLGLAARRRRAA